MPLAAPPRPLPSRWKARLRAAALALLVAPASATPLAAAPRRAARAPAWPTRAWL